VIREFTSTDNPFVFELWIMAKVDEQTQAVPRRLEVIMNLSAVFVRKSETALISKIILSRQTKSGT